jgi:hypothetical protein
MINHPPTLPPGIPLPYPLYTPLYPIVPNWTWEDETGNLSVLFIPIYWLFIGTIYDYFLVSNSENTPLVWNKKHPLSVEAPGVILSNYN